MRFPAARPRKTCDFLPREMLLPPLAPLSSELLTQQTEIVLVSPVFLRLSGLFLLRMAERAFLELLFQEPPRTTRTIITLTAFYAKTPDLRYRAGLKRNQNREKVEIGKNRMAAIHRFLGDRFRVITIARPAQPPKKIARRCAVKSQENAVKR